MKRLMALALSMLMALAIMPTAAFAANNDDVIRENLVNAEGYIYGSVYATPAHSEEGHIHIAPMSGANCPNYATSKETIQLYYSGELSFKANHLTDANCGSGLQASKNVKQGGIDYQRNNASVIGGIKYTTTAPNSSDSTARTVTAGCWDDLLDWSEAGRTYFYRYWFYF